MNLKLKISKLKYKQINKIKNNSAPTEIIYFPFSITIMSSVDDLHSFMKMFSYAKLEYFTLLDKKKLSSFHYSSDKLLTTQTDQSENVEREVMAFELEQCNDDGLYMIECINFWEEIENLQFPL
jgi:hypothetical protein